MSMFNQWDPSRYAADAFANFAATSDLDLGTARALMWAAQLVYEIDITMSPESLDKVKRILAKMAMQFVDVIPVGGFPSASEQLFPVLTRISRVALAISGHGALIVAFAGTDPPRLQDWLVNFGLRPAATGVSQGLHDAAALFVPRIKALRGQNSGLKLFITGHSLGGSLGVAVADALHAAGCDPDGVYTYGMPRAGDPTFAARYNEALGERTFRFVHGDDLVPTVPPAKGLTPLQHVGFLLQCDTGGKFALTQRSPDTSSNEPMRDRDIVSGLAAPTSLFERGLAAIRVLTQGGGVVDSAIAAAPPRIRHHLQDQYIAALTG
ncbi:MAG: lipase family protein [Alphaproteobacteria bacterium]|nr:lipase family protein [Alphaproteobacteria bacterium]